MCVLHWRVRVSHDEHDVVGAMTMHQWALMPVASTQQLTNAWEPGSDLPRLNMSNTSQKRWFNPCCCVGGLFLPWLCLLQPLHLLHHQLKSFCRDIWRFSHSELRRKLKIATWCLSGWNFGQTSTHYQPRNFQPAHCHGTTVKYILSWRHVHLQAI